MKSSLLYIIVVACCAIVNADECKWSKENKIKGVCRFSKKSEPVNLDTLKLVHVVFRHGDRTPDANAKYPKDPYYNETYYPLGYGQLTNLGKKQEYQIGKDLRKRYDKFLGDVYTSNVLDARSTDYNRTKDSLLLVLAGLYPPTQEQIWNPELLWQPIPYNYWKANEDIILDPIDACPKLKQAYHNYLLSEEFQQNNDHLKEFYQYMSENTGLNITTPENVYTIFFTLFAEEYMGMALPEWTKCVWPNKVTNVAIKYYTLMTQTTQMKQYAAGIFLKKILEDSKSLMDGTLTPPGRKLYLYSSHEVNVAFTLIGLKVFYPHVPSYASYVIMELHEVDGVYGFKIWYQDYQGKDPVILQIPGCEDFCPFDKFYDILKDNIPETYDC